MLKVRISEHLSSGPPWRLPVKVPGREQSAVSLFVYQMDWNCDALCHLQHFLCVSAAACSGKAWVRGSTTPVVSLWSREGAVQGSGSSQSTARQGPNPGSWGKGPGKGGRHAEVVFVSMQAGNELLFRGDSQEKVYDGIPNDSLPRDQSLCVLKVPPERNFTALLYSCHWTPLFSGCG